MSADSPKVVGFYTQPYNEIVSPHRIWQIPKYFLRRWGPYLTPLRFWTVVAARQICYWNGEAECFEAFDGAIATEARISKGHYRRIKKEMGEASTAMSLFLTKKPVQYHIVNGRTRPKETEYHLRLDTPITPADAEHLANFLRAQEIPRKAEAIADLLQEAIKLPHTQLLAPTLAPYIQAPPAKFRALTVADVVQQIFGRTLSKNENVLIMADALHQSLTGDDYLGKQYFREKWFKILGAGPAFLITYLRSLCFFNEKTGELRNEVPINRTELAGALGIERTTLHRWMKKLLNATPAQGIPPFLELVESKRVSGNEVISTYRVGMREPLTSADWASYQILVSEIKEIEDTPNPELQNVIHKEDVKSTSELQNVIHEEVMEPNPELQNAIHKKTNHSSELQKDHTSDTRSCKKITGQLQKDHGSVAKCVPNKYYKTLCQSLSLEDISTLLTAAVHSSSYWKFENNLANQPIAQVASNNDFNVLLDLLDVDTGGPARQRIRKGGLDINSIAAWHLYALQQTGLDSPPITLTIKRSQEGLQPPTQYRQLANLSWALWRCYACLLILPPVHRDAFRHEPTYKLWMKIYGRCHPDSLPFDVGIGVSDAMSTILYDEDDDMSTTPIVSLLTKPEPDEQLHEKLWKPVLSELELRLARATFNTWLRSSTLVDVEKNGEHEEHWTVAVGNDYAVDWLTNRLNETTIQPLATALYERAIVISYIVT